MDSIIINRLILIAILTAINGFFASSEMAFVTVDRISISKLAEKGNKKASLILELIEKPSDFLSTIQVGITFAGFFSSASAATGLAKGLNNFLRGNNIFVSENFTIVIITVVLSYFVLVFGEIFPKRVALKKSRAIALYSVKPIWYISKIAKPFIFIISVSTKILLKIFRLDDVNDDDRITEEKIKLILERGYIEGAINANEKVMATKVFEYNDKFAKDIMVPKEEVFMIDINEPFASYSAEYFYKKYSRVPVYEGDADHIIGILMFKDYFTASKNIDIDDIDIRSLLVEATFIKQNIHIDKLFNIMRRKKRHMCILFDNDNKFTGIVTLEDLVEEIMGDIEDEHDMYKV